MWRDTQDTCSRRGRSMSIKSILRLKPSPLRWLPQMNRAGTPYWERLPDGLRVIESFESHGGDDWLHVSASYPDRLPTWDDLREVKETFCGPKREAYIVLPPAERYVNHHSCVLHLWCAVDGPALPDFRRMGPFGRMTI